jgi:glycosyltransferase involved in cell wall biosynthesis
VFDQDDFLPERLVLWPDGLDHAVFLRRSAAVIRGKKVVVVMPAYNASKTLRTTCAEIPMDIVDDIILVDDASRDETVAVAKELGLKTVVHPRNRGYGGNQKSCYKTALEAGADIVIMLHPDYQYTPKLVSAMAYILESGLYDVVLGSRILGGQALKGGMPMYKYISNRFLTMAQNMLMGAKLSEYHTGYRAFTRRVLETVPIERNSDDFVFDNQMLSQIHYMGFSIAEVTCPAKYFEEASSINFVRSLRYGLGCLQTAVQFRLSKMGVYRARLFKS